MKEFTKKKNIPKTLHPNDLKNKTITQTQLALFSAIENTNYILFNPSTILHSRY